MFFFFISPQFFLNNDKILTLRGIKKEQKYIISFLSRFIESISFQSYVTSTAFILEGGQILSLRTDLIDGGG